MTNTSRDPLRAISAELDVQGPQCSLLEYADLLRLDANRKIPPGNRGTLGQYMTPPTTARYMASLCGTRPASVSLLDAGSGVGSLSAAFIAEACAWEKKPATIEVLAFEVDPLLAAYSRRALERCRDACEGAGIQFSGRVLEEDFIVAAVNQVQGGLFAPAPLAVNVALLNPPYGKLPGSSAHRQLLQAVGIESGNLYAAFVWLALCLLQPGGELVALTPRSFCNGPYFRPFRAALLGTMALQQLHLFGARDDIFQEDQVLQETVIVRALKQPTPPTRVSVLSSSTATIAEDLQVYAVPYDQVVLPGDPESIIRIVQDRPAHQLALRMQQFSTKLSDLGVQASTGRVMDFRARSFLRPPASPETAPLVRPEHFDRGGVRWPGARRKLLSQAIAVCPQTEPLLVPARPYVLVKRLSAKEEPRRVSAALFDPALLPTAPLVGFENHLNYLHCHGSGIPLQLARGLVVYLNSALLDGYFRQQSGHTQVNATDLRSLPYPTREQLESLGEHFGGGLSGDPPLVAMA